MQERCLDADNTLLLRLFQSQIERLPRRIPLANRRLVDPLLCDLGLQEPGTVTRRSKSARAILRAVQRGSRAL